MVISVLPVVPGIVQASIALHVDEHRVPAHAHHVTAVHQNPPGSFYGKPSGMGMIY